MSRLRMITGDLEECEKQIIDLEVTECFNVDIVFARPLIETPHLLGSGTGHQVPKVKFWQMLLHLKTGG